VAIDRFAEFALRTQASSCLLSWDAEDRLVSFEDAAEDLQQVLFDANQTLERLDDLRRRHRARIVPTHRQIAIPRHVTCRCRELARDAAEFFCHLHVGAQLVPGVLVCDVERILVDIEIVGHRRRERPERRDETGVIGEAFPAGLLLVVAHAPHDTLNHSHCQLRCERARLARIR
jgi:hypothetical protein